MPCEIYIAEDGLPRIRRPPNARPISGRHPLLHDRVKGVWYPDLVGKVPHYAETREEYEAVRTAAKRQMLRMVQMKKWGCRGIPPGWAGRAKELGAARKAGRERASEIVDAMVDQGITDDEGEEARAALAAVVEIVVTAEIPPPPKPPRWSHYWNEKSIKNLADQIAKSMSEQELPQTEAEMSSAALSATLEVILAKELPPVGENVEKPAARYIYPVRDRLAAAKTVLEFTKVKPVVRTESQLSVAEAWLDSIADK